MRQGTALAGFLYTLAMHPAACQGAVQALFTRLPPKRRRSRSSSPGWWVQGLFFLGILSTLLAGLDLLASAEAQGLLDPETQYRLGERYAREGKEAQAVEVFRRAAEGGHAAAQFALGERYDKGIGVAQDNK